MLLSDLQNLAQNSPLALAQMLSPFVEQTLQKQPKLLAKWQKQAPTPECTGNYAERLAQVLAMVEDEDALAHQLRLFRHREMATLSFLQSNKLASVDWIFGKLSELAEALILGARDWLFARCCEDSGSVINS